MVNTRITDLEFQKLIEQTNRDFFGQVETTIFQSQNIGIGGTAQVKCYELPNGATPLQIAIKYLITPNSKTVSVVEEHDMLREVEDLTEIERLERHTDTDLVRVPHPYFFHQNGRIQCYGMELIAGLTMQDIIDEKSDSELYKQLQNSLSGISEDTLDAQIETFFAQMHTYCLHGDIKPKNIMMSVKGKFYIIDFGQSILVNTIPEEGRDSLDNKKDQEVERTKISINRGLKKLRGLHNVHS